jgi:transcriptional regulator with XRE-family HTH domain
MPQTTVDVAGLYAALDARRKSQGISWRELGRELQIVPSTFTRMAQGSTPDADSFATLLRWLAMEADAFSKPRREAAAEADPVAMFSTYLRADRALKTADAEALTDILQAAYRNLKRRR